MDILIVDDSKAMRMIIRRMLKKAGFGNLTVEEVENGKQALQKIKSKHPKLILCDWNMPEMNGIEMVRAAREEFKLKDIPIVMVTTEANIDKIKEARDAGANGYVTKPFTAEKMKEKIAQVLKRIKK